MEQQPIPPSIVPQEKEIPKKEKPPIYDFNKEKSIFDQDAIMYDKVRWPTYRDLILKRKNQTQLPCYSKQVSKLITLKVLMEKEKEKTKKPSKEQKKDKELESMLQAKMPHENRFPETLVFDANFECGNIDQVRQRDARLFDVWMRNDTNGQNEINWFFFRCKNSVTGNVRINIVNFTKGYSLFTEGMQPSIWSKQKYLQSELGWHQDGSDIVWEQSMYSKETNENNPGRTRQYMQMNFTYHFEHLNDEVFFAYTVPYTYSALQVHLKQLKLLARMSQYEIVKFGSMGISLGGIEIPILKIQNFPQQFVTMTQDDYVEEKTIEMVQQNAPPIEKPVVVIIGRQHPGETHSSFIIHGFINYILSKSILAHKFREQFEVWIIPIVNPDGVVAGNYRSNLQGKDMNRHFFTDNDQDAKGNRCFEVEILREKLKAKFQGQEHMFKMFLDIHAHSTLSSIFIYAPESEKENEKLYVQKFPQMLHQFSEYFMFSNCKFSCPRYKRNCARLSVNRDYGLLDTYTIESSCFGFEIKRKPNQPTNKPTYTEGLIEGSIAQFRPDHFLKFGKQLFICVSRHLGVILEPEKDEKIKPIGYDISLDWCINADDLHREKLCKKTKKDKQRKAEAQQLAQFSDKLLVRNGMASPISQVMPTLQTIQASGTSHNVFLQDKLIRSEKKNRVHNPSAPPRIAPIQPYDKLMTVAEMFTSMQSPEKQQSLLFSPGPNSANPTKKIVKMASIQPQIIEEKDERQNEISVEKLKKSKKSENQKPNFIPYITLQDVEIQDPVIVHTQKHIQRKKPKQQQKSPTQLNLQQQQYEQISNEMMQQTQAQIKKFKQQQKLQSGFLHPTEMDPKVPRPPLPPDKKALSQRQSSIQDCSRYDYSELLPKIKSKLPQKRNSVAVPSSPQVEKTSRNQRLLQQRNSMQAQVITLPDVQTKSPHHISIVSDLDNYKHPAQFNEYTSPVNKSPRSSVKFVRSNNASRIRNPDEMPITPQLSGHQKIDFQKTVIKKQQIKLAGADGRHPTSFEVQLQPFSKNHHQVQIKLLD